jgi:UDP-N-acetylglucosamine 1-carboxyvinyltransferase
MDKLVIHGQRPLKGRVQINGAKNAVLAIVAAACLADDVCVIENIPKIADIDNMLAILRSMNVQTEYLDEHTVRIDSRTMVNCCADSDEVRNMRASYYLLGVLLGRFKYARVSFPGGCDFGVRPIDQHIKGFEALGAEVDAKSIIEIKARELHGTNVFLDVVSVGATINIMLAAVLARGTTVIENAAKEPHVVDTASFLNSMGADIKGAGTDVIRIKGTPYLHGSTYAVIPDQIETGTLMIAAAATRGDVVISGCIPTHMEALTAKLLEMGVRVTDSDDAIRVRMNGAHRAVNVKTQVYPGFPTDLQQPMSALLTTAHGTSIIQETIFESRFKHMDELIRMGAQIRVMDRTAIIEGVTSLYGAPVTATDLRAGAALLVAGLMAKGETEIYEAEYIDRGYEHIESKLRSLGATIRREPVEG